MLLEDYRNERLKKLEELKNRGIDPYPAKSFRNTKISEIINHFDEKNGQEVTIAGRITAIRSFGKIAFIRIKDYYGEIQIFLQKESDNNIVTEKNPSETAKQAPPGNLVSETVSRNPYEDFERSEPRDDGRERLRSQKLSLQPSALTISDIKLLDTGDFIESTGTVGKTQTGEISLLSNSVRLLTKSLRPLPEKFTNKEERYRRRYVDMNVNPEVRARLVRRSKFWQATRDFMNNHGFIEINIPVLEHTTGGADATPFETHMNALDEDFYLRISHELPLKRLLGGGFEKVYDIGPRFRNEGVDDEHLPEHIAFESYAAYENYEDGMNL